MAATFKQARDISIAMFQEDSIDSSVGKQLKVVGTRERKINLTF